LVSLAESVFGVPTWTLPKFRLEGAEVSDPAVTAVAATGIASRLFEASLVTDSAPATTPPDVGLKVTVKAAL